MKIYLPDAPATDRLGQSLVRSSLGAGRVALAGDLGAGKTSLVRACLRALGEDGPIRSPTYTLLEIYESKGYTVHHLDLYRLGRDDDVSDLELRELGSTAWCFVEWPDRLQLDFRFDLRVSLVLHQSGRQATLSAETKHGNRWLDRLESELKLNMR